MTDSPIATTDPTPIEAWVTVSDAATKARVDSSTVRHWYRSGRLPTQRSEGERGAFLVPLNTVLALAARLGDEEDDGASRPGGTDASYWSVQIEAAREEAGVARQSAADARQRLEETEGQLGFLRSQLAEMSEENRNLRVQLETTTSILATAKNDVERLRGEAAAVSSITDFSWLDRTKAYESPVRPQQRLGASTLSGMLADMQPDVSPDVPPVPVAPDKAAPQDDSAADRLGATDAASDDDSPAAAALYPGYGHHEDDLIPQSDKKRRRG